MNIAPKTFFFKKRAPQCADDEFGFIPLVSTSDQSDPAVQNCGTRQPWWSSTICKLRSIPRHLNMFKKGMKRCSADPDRKQKQTVAAKSGAITAMTSRSGGGGGGGSGGASYRSPSAKVKTWRRSKDAAKKKQTEPSKEESTPQEPATSGQNAAAPASAHDIACPQSGGGQVSPRAKSPPAAAAASAASAASLSRSEPALNIYLQQRQVVSQSKFLLDEQQQQQQQEAKYSGDAEKTSRYQKLARDTKMLVARLSGEIASSEKIRQALKLPASSSRKDSVDITDPSFTCDEHTAAILLAELEGKQVEQVKAEAGAPLLQEASAMSQRLEKECEMDAFLKSHRFAQLRSLYRSLERLGQLEKTISTSDLSRIASERVVDFDLWRQLRRRERAEEEMRNLSTWIRSVQKDGDCYFATKDAATGKWKGDSGLRIKDNTVGSLAEKFRTISDNNYSTRSLPRNFSSASSSRSAAAGLLRRSSLTHKQMEQVKVQLSRVYNRGACGAAGSDVSPYEITVASKVQLRQPQLFVRSSSDTASEKMLPEQTDSGGLTGGGKALSVTGAAPAASTTTPPAADKAAAIDSGGGKSTAEQEPARIANNSTRAAIQYVQKLSDKLQQNMSDDSGRNGASGSRLGAEERADSRMSCSSRESSISGQSQRDYLLVLTPGHKENNIDDVESVVKEWAAIQTTLPKRSSSLCYDGQIREEDSLSSGSSAQTVIHRDVLDKVKFFERVIEKGKPRRRITMMNPMRIVHSVSDLSARMTPPQSRIAIPERSQSLHVTRNLAPESRPVIINGVKAVKEKLFRNHPAAVRKPPATYLEQHNSRRRDVKSTINSLARRPSLPATPNKTVIKAQELGDVRLMKRRYEDVRLRRTLRCTSTPVLNGKSSSGGVPSFSWSRRFSGASRKQVSFPNIVFPADPAAAAAAYARHPSPGRGGGVRKLIDFTRVKPTLLSSARLALRNQQCGGAPAPPKKKPDIRITTKPAGVTQVKEADAESNRIPSGAPDRVMTSPTLVRNLSPTSVTSGRSVVSPVRSSAVSPVRSVSSGAGVEPAAPDKKITSKPITSSATWTTSAVTCWPTSPPPAPAPTSSGGGVATKADALVWRPMNNNGAKKTSTCHFDPAMHQPKFRYTPPPPASVARNRFFQMYATYPRRRIYRPPRPPLPTEFYTKTGFPYYYAKLCGTRKTLLELFFFYSAQCTPPHRHTQLLIFVHAITFAPV